MRCVGFAENCQKWHIGACKKCHIVVQHGAKITLVFQTRVSPVPPNTMLAQGWTWKANFGRSLQLCIMGVRGGAGAKTKTRVIFDPCGSKIIDWWGLHQHSEIRYLDMCAWIAAVRSLANLPDMMSCGVLDFFNYRIMVSHTNPSTRCFGGFFRQASAACPTAWRWKCCKTCMSHMRHAGLAVKPVCLTCLTLPEGKNKGGIIFLHPNVRHVRHIGFKAIVQ